MKIKLLQLEEARNEGRRYMKRLKLSGDEFFPECQQLSAQCLRDNADRIKQKKTIMSPKIVRNRQDVEEQIADAPNNDNNQEPEDNENIQIKEENDQEVIQQTPELRAEDEELKELFEVRMKVQQRRILRRERD